jgi:hypothetical protein
MLTILEMGLFRLLQTEKARSVRETENPLKGTNRSDRPARDGLQASYLGLDCGTYWLRRVATISFCCNFRPNDLAQVLLASL